MVNHTRRVTAERRCGSRCTSSAKGLQKSFVRESESCKSHELSSTFNIHDPKSVRTWRGLDDRRWLRSHNNDIFRDFDAFFIWSAPEVSGAHPQIDECRRRGGIDRVTPPSLTLSCSSDALAPLILS